MSKVEKLVHGLHEAFSYTGDNNRDLVGDPTFPMHETVEELNVEWAYQFLVSYAVRNEGMLEQQLEDWDV